MFWAFYLHLTFTFMLRAFSRCFCPKRLRISTFVTREKPRYITVDGVKEVYKQLSSPHLRIVTATCQRLFKCISVMIEVLTYKCIQYIIVLGGGGIGRESCYAMFSHILNENDQ